MGAKLTFEYDREGDLLTINKCPPYAEQDSEEIGDEVIARLNPETGEVEGFEILSFSKRLLRGDLFDIPVPIRKSAPAYYMVRPMDQSQEALELFSSKNVVAVGWSRVNFSQYDDVEKLLDKVRTVYEHGQKYHPSVAGRKREEIRRFKGIKKGDKIVVPWGREYVAIATAGSAEIYDSKAGEQLDLANQRLVRYVRDKDDRVKEFSRSELPPDFRKRLSVRGSTCRDLGDFRDEILGLLSGKKTSSASIEEELEALTREIPQEERDKLPKDLADNLDHYLYGTEKK